MSATIRLASEVLDQAEEIAWLRAEVSRLQDVELEYRRYVSDSIAASERQMASWIGGIMDGKLKIES